MYQELVCEDTVDGVRVFPEGCMKRGCRQGIGIAVAAHYVDTVLKHRKGYAQRQGMLPS